MKKVITTLALIFIFTCTNTIKAQESMDVFGIIPQNFLSNQGWGIGFNMFSKGYPIGLKINGKTLESRFGGGFYISSLNRKKINNVPLDLPQIGNATVYLYNYALGLNAISRFSYPYSEKITPYADVFGGFRFFTADMSIRPNQKNTEYEASTSKNLSTSGQLNVGLTGGVMWSLSKCVKLNAGIMYTHSKKTDLIYNANQARLESDALMIDKINTPKNFYMLICGITFLVDMSDNTGTTCRSSSGRISSGGSIYRGSGTKSNGIRIGSSRPNR